MICEAECALVARTLSTRRTCSLSKNASVRRRRRAAPRSKRASSARTPLREATARPPLASSQRPSRSNPTTTSGAIPRAERLAARLKSSRPAKETGRPPGGAIMSTLWPASSSARRSTEIPTNVPLPLWTSAGVPVTKSSRATAMVYTGRRARPCGLRAGPGLLREDPSLLREGDGRAGHRLLARPRPALAARPHPGDRQRPGLDHGGAVPRGAGLRDRRVARDAPARFPPAVPREIRRGRHARRRLRLPLRPDRRSERSPLSLDKTGRPPQSAVQRGRCLDFRG